MPCPNRLLSTGTASTFLPRWMGTRAMRLGQGNRMCTIWRSATAQALTGSIRTRINAPAFKCMGDSPVCSWSRTAKRRRRICLAMSTMCHSVIQDRAFNGANQLVYATNPMVQMSGVLGDRILVNGRPDFAINVATRTYRFRVLNGSNSRVYKLAWEDGTPLTVIATDGGLL